MKIVEPTLAKRRTPMISNINIYQPNIITKKKLWLSDCDQDLLIDSIESSPKFQGKLKSAITKHQDKYEISTKMHLLYPFTKNTNATILI
jgi:hypothetical protein